jgi:hypothetical protein
MLEAYTAKFVQRLKTIHTIQGLNDYDNWVGFRPELIRQAVIVNGGWEKVFPNSKKFPVWASKIRNYFNVVPKKLTLLSKQDGKKKTKAVIRFNNFSTAKQREVFRVQEFAIYAAMGWGGNQGDALERFEDKVKDPAFAAMALSEDVYRDEKNRFWYQMTPSGAGYHFKNRNWAEKSSLVKAARGVVTSQSYIPVFKLISPDGTGGSWEVCTHNIQRYIGGKWAFGAWISKNCTRSLLFPGGLMFDEATKGKSTIGEVGETVKLIGRILTDPKLMGSYNYSETVRAGYTAHVFRDVDSHKGSSGFYVNPEEGTTLESREFKKTMSGQWIGDLAPRG